MSYYGTYMNVTIHNTSPWQSIVSHILGPVLNVDDRLIEIEKNTTQLYFTMLQQCTRLKVVKNSKYCKIMFKLIFANMTYFNVHF